MITQRKYQTYQPADPAQFADGSSARRPPAGVVPRSGPALAAPSDVVPLDAVNPLPPDRATLEAGQLQFDVFCTACHGRLGNGAGMIVQRGFTRPPSFHVDRLRAAPDAHFYNVITRGYGAMMSHDDGIAPAARWAIVAYVRALQAAPDVAPPASSTDVKAALIAQGDRPAAVPPKSPAPEPAPRP